MTPAVVRVAIEAGKRRVFASALDWPGWSRSARDEAGALDALADYEPRYRAVVEHAGFTLPEPYEFVVVERLEGDATTDFGAPGAIAAVDLEPLSEDDAVRFAALVAAAGETLRAVAARAPAELRKGPRGGGRDRDAVVAHVEETEPVYLRQLARGRWTERTTVRRRAWHALDHAWEIEDRS